MVVMSTLIFGSRAGTASRIQPSGARTSGSMRSVCTKLYELRTSPIFAHDGEGAK